MRAAIACPSSGSLVSQLSHSRGQLNPDVRFPGAGRVEPCMALPVPPAVEDRSGFKKHTHSIRKDKRTGNRGAALALSREIDGR
jgi:hypothetical protein